MLGDCDMEGADDGASLWPRRPRRNAAARREQKLRAEARTVQKLLRGFQALAAHRGCRPSVLGAALASALSAQPEAYASEEMKNKEPMKYSAFASASEETKNKETWNIRADAPIFVPSDPGDGADASASLAAPCIYFAAGACLYGAGCRFRHDATRGAHSSSEIVESSVSRPWNVLVNPAPRAGTVRVARAMPCQATVPEVAASSSDVRDEVRPPTQSDLGECVDEVRAAPSSGPLDDVPAALSGRRGRGRGRRNRGGTAAVRSDGETSQHGAGGSSVQGAGCVAVTNHRQSDQPSAQGLIGSRSSSRRTEETTNNFELDEPVVAAAASSTDPIAVIDLTEVVQTQVNVMSSEAEDTFDGVSLFCVEKVWESHDTSDAEMERFYGVEISETAEFLVDVAREMALDTYWDSVTDVTLFSGLGHAIDVNMTFRELIDAGLLPRIWIDGGVRHVWAVQAVISGVRDM